MASYSISGFTLTISTIVVGFSVLFINQKTVKSPKSQWRQKMTMSKVTDFAINSTRDSNPELDTDINVL